MKPYCIWQDAAFYSLRRQSFRPSEVLFNGRLVASVSDLYFDPPGRDVVGTILQQYTSHFWSPMLVVSVASDSEGPKVFDEGGERAVHDTLVSNSFALHPEFGTGHLIRTNGSVGAFWDGSATHVVRVENLIPLRVVLSRSRPVKVSRKEKVAALLASI